MNLVKKSLVEGARCKDVPAAEIFSYENQTIPEMSQLMTKNYGVGLAGPQVGINRNFFIMKYGNRIISCYNPKWTTKNPKRSISKEGCLTYQPSWKNQANILRYKTIIAEFLNGEGIPEKIKLRGNDAIIFQHESDHLVGKTIFFDPKENNDRKN